MRKLLISVFISCSALTACSSVEPVLNEPLELSVNPDSVTHAVGADDQEAGEKAVSEKAVSKKPNRLALILTFSGGGTRAAAFSYGVLKGLRDLRIKPESESSYPLLQEIDLISSVSGGSFTAAYYGLYGEQTFDDYERRFLKQPVQTNLILDGLFKPTNWLKLLPGFYNRSDLAAEFYGRHIFGAKTFADFPDSAPQIVINATDLSLGTAFSFTEDNFRWICSERDSYPVGRAVAASAAIPVVFSPIPLRNYSGCQRQSAAHQAGALSSKNLSVKNSKKSTEKAIEKHSVNKPNISRNTEQSLAIRQYQRTEQYPFLHLVDGGISDNLGVRSLLNVVAEHDDNFWEVMRSLSLERTRDVVFLVVNASDMIPPEIALVPDEPDTAATLAAMTTIQFSRYNSDTLDMLEDQFPRWAEQVVSARCQQSVDVACDDIVFHLIELNFKQLPEGEFKELAGIRTSLELPSDQVDKLVRAGEQLLKSSPRLQQLLKRLSNQNKSLPKLSH